MIVLGLDATVPPAEERVVLGLDATVPPTEGRLCWAWMLLFRRLKGRMIVLGRGISTPPAENERRQVQVK